MSKICGKVLGVNRDKEYICLLSSGHEGRCSSAAPYTHPVRGEQPEATMAPDSESAREQLFNELLYCVKERYIDHGFNGPIYHYTWDKKRRDAAFDKYEAAHVSRVSSEADESASKEAAEELDWTLKQLNIHRTTHVHWRDHLKKGPCTDCSPEVIKNVGDLAEQEASIGHYDRMIAAIEKAKS